MHIATFDIVETICTADFFVLLNTFLSQNYVSFKFSSSRVPISSRRSRNSDDWSVTDVRLSQSPASDSYSPAFARDQRIESTLDNDDDWSKRPSESYDDWLDRCLPDETANRILDEILRGRSVNQSRAKRPQDT